MPALYKSVELFNQRKVDLVIHAGDLISPFTARAIKKLKCPYILIYGNNDGEILGLKKVFGNNIFQPPHQIMINDKKVLILHDPIILDELKNNSNYDVIIYGHLHEVSVKEGKPLIINPGECGGWLNDKCTIGIWNVENNKVEIIELNYN